MAKHLVGMTLIRRGVVVTAALAVASGVAVCTGAGGAGASPAPAISQVQAEVNGLQARVDKIGQQYDAAGQQLTAAKAQLDQVSKQAASVQARYSTASAGLTAVAVAAYENSSQTSVLGLLSSGDPASVLARASLVLEVAGTHNAQAGQFLTAAKDLATIRLQRQHTQDGIAQMKAQLAGEKSSLTMLLASKQATLDSLTTAQQAQVTASTLGYTAPAGSTAPPVTYTGPAATQAGKAVAFAYAQIGKPYGWGAVGPYSYDCSGLVQAAWQAAGVSIPRTTYEQWAALPHIPMTDLQPGDLIFYEGEGHVAMYVGGGYIIDAPQTGLNVEETSDSFSWYAQNANGAVRP